MRVGRPALIAALVAWLLLGSSGSASAEIGEHTGGAKAGAVIVGGAPVAIAIAAPSGTVASWEHTGGASGPRWTCGYYGFENGSSSGVSISIDYRGGPRQPVPGHIYGLLCRDQAGDVVYSWFGVYDPADPFAGLLAGERAAEVALERLELSDPVVRFNPPGDQLVGLQSWLWVDTPWAPAAVAASVTGVTATVTASPQFVAWDMGDGHALTCRGPGLSYDASKPPDQQASDCSHAYDWPSYTRSGGVYEVTAKVTYAVTWHATDGTGAELEPVTRSTTVPVRVVEVQAVIN
jgi:hypothetical protein